MNETNARKARSKSLPLNFPRKYLIQDVTPHDPRAYVDECENEGPVIITRNGKAAAVLLAPRDNDDLERLMLAHSRRFQALLSKSRRSIKAGKGVSHDEFWKTVAWRHQTKRSLRGRKK
jgi:PHD/YefM family antitoxin component YafN of YafNO toxin-antitoxin module